VSKLGRVADQPAFEMGTIHLGMKLEGERVSAKRECLIAAEFCRSEPL